jgi:hypothetical protein
MALLYRMKTHLVNLIVSATAQRKRSSAIDNKTKYENLIVTPR